MKTDEILSMIMDAEYQAGEQILHAHDIIAENKTDARNVVTEYDRNVQELLIGTFKKMLPEAHFFCEENDVQDSLSAEHVFIIDPIDGTANFVNGFHHSCVSVAYASFGEVCAAAVYNPYVDEMFTAQKGKGAFLNKKQIHVSDANLSASVACIGTSPYYHEIADRTFRMIRFLYDNALDIRREGSAALDLCSVACGRAGLFVELRLSYWDYAAGALIVEEAGGQCWSSQGIPLPADGSKSAVIGAGSGIEISDDLLGL